MISLFTGAGGACLGYRRAGFLCVAASEFIESARETYLANFPGTPVDPRDVRLVRGHELLDLGAVGEVDFIEGSPPCSAFSVSGKLAGGWGKARSYSSTAQRVDDLLLEFARLVDEIRPRAFAAENVAGLARGVSKGFLIDLVSALRKSSYRVKAMVLDAAALGVPQRRRRVFVVGIRGDLGRDPEFPVPIGRLRTVREALVGVPAPSVPEEAGPSIDRFAIGREAARLAPGESSSRYQNLVRAPLDGPCPTITQTAGVAGAASVVHPTEPRKFSVPELRRLCGFPDDFVLVGSYRERVERLGRAVPPPMAEAVGRTVLRVLQGDRP
jgi:DNA (cytosine-5)-methyltransferase 1